MEPTVTKFVDIYEGKSIVEIITDSIGGLSSGVTGSVAEAFNALVLTPDGRLSALAIWALSMFGISFVWKIVPMAIRFFKSRRC